MFINLTVLSNNDVTQSIQHEVHIMSSGVLVTISFMVS